MSEKKGARALIKKWIKAFLPEFTVPSSMCVVAGVALVDASVVNLPLLLTTVFLSSFFFFAAHWIWDAIRDHDEQKLGWKFEDLKSLRLGDFSLSFALPIFLFISKLLSVDKFLFFYVYLGFITVFGYAFNRYVDPEKCKTDRTKQIVTIVRSLLYALYAFTLPFLGGWMVFSLVFPTSYLISLSLILFIVGITVRVPKIYEDRFFRSMKGARISGFLLFVPYLVTPISYVVLDLTFSYLVASGIGAFLMMLLGLFLSWNHSKEEVIYRVRTATSILSAFFPLAILIMNFVQIDYIHI